MGFHIFAQTLSVAFAIIATSLSATRVLAQDATPTPRYEPPVEETVPPLTDALRAEVKNRAPIVAKKQIINGRARLTFDNVVSAPVFHVTPYWTPDKAHIADFKNAGVSTHAVSVWLGKLLKSGTRGVWTGANQYDFSSFEEAMWRVLRVDPQARIILYLNTDPYQDWGAENPNEVLQDQDGKKPNVFVHPNSWGVEGASHERLGSALVSQKLRDDTAAALRAFINYIQTQSETGKAVVGYHLGGMNDGQFLPWDEHWPQPHLADYSPATRDAFRGWLRQKYTTDAALQTAWNNPLATIATAEVPSASRRLESGFFLTARGRDLLDFNRFYSEGIAETLALYAYVIKGATGGTKLVGTYYPDAATGVISHLALSRVLSSPDIDYLAAPAKYGIRLPGESSAAGMLLESLTLRKKIYVQEQDWRSWHSALDSGGAAFVGRADNAAQHNAMVRRDSGMMLSRGMGTWFYDMSGGWFADAGMMQGIAEAKRAFDKDMQFSDAARADVAVFVGETPADTLGHTTMAAALRVGVVHQIEALNKSGVPYHLYLQSDLTSADLPRYKNYIFLNAYTLSSEERTAINALKNGGRVLVFCHAPRGGENGDTTSFIRDLTGITVAPHSDNIALQLQPMASTQAPFNVAVLSEGEALSGPSWKVNDALTTPLGTYSDGAVGAARRDFGTWKSVYFGGVGMSAPFINALAKYSGAWVAAPAGDAVYANRRFVTIHATSSGTKKITLAASSRITDLTSGALLSNGSSTLSLSMQRGETRWFSLAPLP